MVRDPRMTTALRDRMSMATRDMSSMQGMNDELKAAYFEQI